MNAEGNDHNGNRVLVCDDFSIPNFDFGDDIRTLIMPKVFTVLYNFGMLTKVQWSL